jgi:receptor-interacting serine/threonine-protein kinase 5
MFNNMPWSASPRLDEEWKVSTATNMLNSLSESKLAKIVCNQMRERLESSHKIFISSLKLLEARHNGRLEKAEEKQNLIRKISAPKFAKLCLESTYII